MDNFDEHIAQLRQHMTDVDRRVQLALEAAQVEVVAFARSTTGEMQPPVRKGESERPAHPGHWADVTGALKNGYQGEATQEGPHLHRMAVSNHVGHADQLEKTEQYWVVSGLETGGHMEAAAEKHLKAQLDTLTRL